MNLLFSFKEFTKMAEEMGVERGDFTLKRFANQELHVTIKTPVHNKTCLVLGSISPPDENLLAILIVSHTMKKEGAKKCIAVLPYLAYSRHDHNEKGESEMAMLLGKFFAASSIDALITFDLHSQEAKSLLGLPITSLSTADLFASELKKLPFGIDSFISPDEGGIERCKSLAAAYGTPHCICHMKKKRDGLTHFDLVGNVGKIGVIVDDILDTGETLLSCVKKLHLEGLQKCIIMVTHGLFTGEKWKELFSLGVEKIYCTDTVPSNKPRDLRIISLSILAPLEKACSTFV